MYVRIYVRRIAHTWVREKIVGVGLGLTGLSHRTILGPFFVLLPDDAVSDSESVPGRQHGCWRQVAGAMSCK